MTPPIGTSAVTVAVSFAAGTVVISVVLVAIGVLVIALWRRSAGSGGVPRAVSPGPRTDSHAISAISSVFSPAPAAPAQAEAQPEGPSETPPGVAPGNPERPNPARAPHPSGLGAAELAAIVEEGLASLRSDLETLGDIIDSVGSASAVPEDLPTRPASQQVALVDQMVAMIAADLERAHRLAEAVAVDVDRGHRARAEVHGELSRIGLPGGFFAAMDTTAADLAVDLVRARMAVDRLTRRFESLSSLYSSVRPTVELVGDLGDALERAAAVADPWRRAPENVDLVRHSQTPQPLPG